MKSTNIYNLRASVEHEVWSSTKGANRVLQNAWENRKPEEKIIFIFSITHRYGVSTGGENHINHLRSHRYGGKYCGLAEMSGPFDSERAANIWTEGLQGNEGVIPTRWIVAKDVEFSVFDDLKYNDKRVTQLRHASTYISKLNILLVLKLSRKTWLGSKRIFPLPRLVLQLQFLPRISNADSELCVDT